MHFRPNKEISASIVESPHDLADHVTAVVEIAERVRELHGRQHPFRIFHGSTNSTRQNVLRKAGSVDVSKLDRILRVDKSRKLILVEPNVPMDRLVEMTLRYGLVPAVITEFPGITVGGAYAGTAGEVSFHGTHTGIWSCSSSLQQISLVNGFTCEIKRYVQSCGIHSKLESNKIANCTVQF
jgi:delta24-sterol reductase